jgi:hypothetical protein
MHRISLRRRIRPRHISPVKGAIAVAVAVAASVSVARPTSPAAGNTPVPTGTRTGSYICSLGLTGPSFPSGQPRTGRSRGPSASMRCRPIPVSPPARARSPVPTPPPGQTSGQAAGSGSLPSTSWWASSPARLRIMARSCAAGSRTRAAPPFPSRNPYGEDSVPGGNQRRRLHRQESDVGGYSSNPRHAVGQLGYGAVRASGSAAPLPACFRVPPRTGQARFGHRVLFALCAAGLAGQAETDGEVRDARRRIRRVPA